MIFIHILEQSLVFLPFSLGIFISYGILKKADLTVDGSFVLGAGVFAKLSLLGFPTLFGLAGTLCAGALAGIGTSCIQYRDRVSSLIAGILMLFILQSINLIIMGRPNLNLLGTEHLLNSSYGALPVLLAGTALLTLTLYGFLTSRLGLMLRAFGCNPFLLQFMGRKTEHYRILGFALSNALTAYSGALTAQFNGYADSGMGTGLVLIGMGTIILGKHLEKSFSLSVPSIFIQVSCCTLGVVTYFSVLNVIASMGLNPLYLKMVIGCVLAGILIAQSSKSQPIGAAG